MYMYIYIYIYIYILFPPVTAAIMPEGRPKSLTTGPLQVLDDATITDSRLRESAERAYRTKWPGNQTARPPGRPAAWLPVASFMLWKSQDMPSSSESMSSSS